MTKLSNLWTDIGQEVCQAYRKGVKLRHICQHYEITEYMLNKLLIKGNVHKNRLRTWEDAQTFDGSSLLIDNGVNNYWLGYSLWKASFASGTVRFRRKLKSKYHALKLMDWLGLDCELTQTEYSSVDLSVHSYDLQDFYQYLRDTWKTNVPRGRHFWRGYFDASSSYHRYVKKRVSYTFSSSMPVEVAEDLQQYLGQQYPEVLYSPRGSKLMVQLNGPVTLSFLSHFYLPENPEPADSLFDPTKKRQLSTYLWEHQGHTEREE